MTQVTPDPKPAPRVKDPDAYARFHRFYQECLHCGNRHISFSHLLSGNDREDVFEAGVPLCGGGTSGCHGAWHGHAYIGDFGKKVTPRAVRWSVHFFISSEAGNDQRAYLQRKLGPAGYEAYMERLEY